MLIANNRMPKANTPSFLSELLGSRARTEILRILWSPAHPRLHLRALERETGLNVATVRRETERLCRLELLTGTTDGNRTVFEANRSHPIAPELTSLIAKTVGVVAILREALTDPAIRWAFLFGSAARGEERAHSDIDLMVIGDIGLRGITARLSKVGPRLGREVNPRVFSEGEFRNRVARREHFVSRVLSDPRVFVVGADDEFAAMVGESLAETA